MKISHPKTKFQTYFHVCWALGVAFPSFSLGFDSGSNGSFGPLTIDASGQRTIQLPPDGILHCTTISIETGKYLYFSKNATNTPAYLLATGDVTIDGFIIINGEASIGKKGGLGGPGGYDGGNAGAAPSNGLGPGGGTGGWSDANPDSGWVTRGAGAFATTGNRTTSGAVYGSSILIPIVGGSGGGGGYSSEINSRFGGGGGGGALVIASNTKISMSGGGTYPIFATGGSSTSGYGGGSGGAVRLVAPLISGNKDIRVAGKHEGGFGRIRVDAITNTLTLNDNDNSASYATFGSNMVVFPPNMPELRIVKAAGSAIPLTQTDPVFVLLPSGSPATQTVQVQATNFRSIVPLVAVVTPEAGNKTTYNFDVDNTGAAAGTGSVEVQIPAGVSTRIDVWTR